MQHDPWQLYLENEAGDSALAFADLEDGWLFARLLATPQAASSYMEKIMHRHANAGAADSEGYQELNRRLRRIWPDWD